jgi:hypothetical protein
MSVIGHLQSSFLQIESSTIGSHPADLWNIFRWWIQEKGNVQLWENSVWKNVLTGRNSLLYSLHAPFWSCIKHGIILYEIWDSLIFFNGLNSNSYKTSKFISMLAELAVSVNSFNNEMFIVDSFWKHDQVFRRSACDGCEVYFLMPW